MESTRAGRRDDPHALLREPSVSVRPDIRFIPMSTDFGKIRFFGTLMPALLLLFRSPWSFVKYQIARRITPHREAAELIASSCDDAIRVRDTLVFLHRWESDSFDPFAFARAKVFLARITRMTVRAGYRAEPLDPLSPALNLPKLAASAGLGNLSPFGLLVHPRCGPRLIITALRTDAPWEPARRVAAGHACTDCGKCIEVCPQRPREGRTIDIGQCQRCVQCLSVCPVGKQDTE